MEVWHHMHISLLDVLKNNVPHCHWNVRLRPFKSCELIFYFYFFKCAAGVKGDFFLCSCASDFPSVALFLLTEIPSNGWTR